MSIPPAATTVPVRLRLDAEARLKEGSAPPATVWSTGANALSLLYTLASSPASADDALKLLHELQVHQVELDLQHEQMEISHRELVEELGRYKGFYESAPVGYFNLDSEGTIIEGNVAGAQLFGLQRRELDGRRLETLLAPASRPVLLQLLQELRDGAPHLSCEVESGAGNTRLSLRVVASAAADRASLLLVIVPTGAPRPESQLV